MSLSAWERQALESIQDGLAGSDPELAALLSVFNRLASDEKMPDREKTRAGSQRAFRPLRRAPRRSRLRRVFHRLGFGRAALLLWLLTTAALLAVALALNAGGNRGTCTTTAAMTCISPAPGRSPGSPSVNTTTSRASRQPVSGIIGPPSW